MHIYYVYIMASKRNGVLYIGVTNNLPRRVSEHRQGQIDGFSKTYHTKRLVYFEPYQYIDQAIMREKAMKRWKRAWKIELIESTNSEWNDLYSDLE